MQSGGKVPQDICRKVARWIADREAESAARVSETHAGRPDAGVALLAVTSDDRRLVLLADGSYRAAIITDAHGGGQQCGAGDTAEVLMDGRRQRVPRANVMEYDARRLMTSTSTSTTPPPSPTPRSLEGVTNMPGQPGGSSRGSVRHGSTGGT